MWTASCAAGLGSTGAVSAWIALRCKGDAGGAAVAVPIALLAGLVIGAVIGALQGTLVSRRLPRAGIPWTVASALGACIATGGAVFALTTYESYIVPHPAYAYALLCGCLVTGSAQALVLGGRARVPFVWPLAKLAALCAGGVAWFAIGASWLYSLELAWSQGWALALPTRPWMDTALWTSLCIVPGIVYGGISGIVLLAQLPDR